MVSEKKIQQKYKIKNKKNREKKLTYHHFC